MSWWERVRKGFGELVEDLSVSDAVRLKLNEARASLEAGEIDRAISLLEKATNDDPDHFRSWQLLGMALLRADRRERAVAALQRAAALKPDSFEVLVLLAQAYRATGENQQCLDSARAALHCRVDEGALDQVYALAGEVYLERGEIDRAVRELRKAVAVSGGKDPELLGLLGRAHFADGNLPLARQSLERAVVATPPDPQLLVLLVEVLLALGIAQEAQLAAARLLQEQPADGRAHCLLGQSLLAAGDLVAAREQLLYALEHAPGDSEVHRLLGEVYLASGDREQALRQLRIAREKQQPDSPSGVSLLRQLLELQLEMPTQDDALADDTRALLKERAEDPLAMACAAIVARADGSRAQGLVARSLAAGESFAGRLALAIVHLAHDEPREAVTALRAALRLRPSSARAQSLLRQALAEITALDPRQTDEEADDRVAFYPLLRRVQALLAGHGALTDLQQAVAQIERDFDRPLLVAVMGEFNSGKSTFVNALIGEEIAPMGVTPTTATINVLKYGQQRSARVIWRDDREELLEWEAVAPFLRGLGNQRARQVRVVELLYPSEELLRVNVVDTPGLNSMIAEHEVTAREYLQQADAVVWLFSADQAGKQTEQEALDLIRKQRLKTVGVVNKVDRLAAQQLEQVTAHLQEGFGELVEAIIPVSARDALGALVAGDDEALSASGFVQLRALLEQRFFGRSRQLKRQVCEQKLLGTMAHATSRIDAELQPLGAALASLQQRVDELHAAAAADPRQQERGPLRQDIEAVFRGAADEVLDFVRPRRATFLSSIGGGNGGGRASDADRDYLVELLEQRLGGVSARSSARIAEALEQLSEPLFSTLAAEVALQRQHVEAVEHAVDQQLTLLRQQVYARFEAYARGFLRGGHVDRFFERLRELSLEPDQLYRALTDRLLDVDAELLGPLSSWHSESIDALVAAVAAAQHDLSMSALQLDAALRAPLQGLLDRLGADT